MVDKKALSLLGELVSIQSVSTDPERHPEIIKASKLIRKELESIGLAVTLHEQDGCPPLIVGILKVSDQAPTIAAYAHYDVQPEDPRDKWLSPPYALTERDGKLFGRGVSDDKMHLVQALTAVRRLVESKSAKNNLIFIFEGEEEQGSFHFEDLVNKVVKDLSRADVFYILDVGMKTKEIPQIFYGLRGIIGFEIKVTVGETDLHSGVYGNRVLNPAQVLSNLFAKMKNDRGRVTVPGFYNQVKRFGKKEIALLSKYVTDGERERKDAKIKHFSGGFLDSKILPSLDINGITAGYTGQGFKTIIPSEATAKFSVRLVEHQKATVIADMVAQFVARNMPKEVDYVLEMKGLADPFFTDFNNPFALKTAAILSKTFGKECLFNRSGGSIPAAEILQRVFKKPIILTGFTLPDENIHAPNENADLVMFEKGISALQEIFSVAP